MEPEPTDKSSTDPGGDREKPYNNELGIDDILDWEREGRGNTILIHNGYCRFFLDRGKTPEPVCDHAIEDANGFLAWAKKYEV